MAAMWIGSTASASNTPDVWLPQSPGGPPGAATDVIYTDPSNAGHVYAGTMAQGLFFSATDGLGAAAWTSINGSATPVNIGIEAIASDDPQGNTCPWLFIIADDVLYESEDGGGTWTSIYSDETAYALTLALDAANGVLYLGTAAGIERGALSSPSACGDFRTVTWAAQNTGFPVDNATPFVTHLILSGSTLFAALTAPGIWTASTGASQTWTETSNATQQGQSGGGTTLTSLGAFGVGYTNYASSAMTTTDGGASWHALAGSNVPAVVAGMAAIGGTLFVSDGSFVYSNTSATSGTWTRKSRLEDSSFLANSLASDPSTNTLFGFSGTNGIRASQDSGSTFVRADSGITAACVPSLAIASTDGSSATLFAATEDFAAVSNDRGLSWTVAADPLLPDTTNVVAIDPSDTSSLWLGNSGGLFQGAGSGVWSPVGAPTYVTKLNFVSPDFWQLQGEKVYISENRGETWTPLSIADVYYSVVMNKPDKLYAVTDAGVSVGRFDGSTVTLVPAAGENLTGFIDYIVADFTAGTTLIVSTSTPGVFFSSDEGATWTPAAPTPDPTQIYQLAVDPSSHELFAFANRSIAKSTNHGACWVDISTANLPYASAQSLVADPVTLDDLYLATSGAGVLRMTEDAFATPRISNLSPSSLATTGGTVIVNGTHFRAGSTVTIGGTELTPSTIAADGTSLTINVPTESEGSFDVTVSAPVAAQACALSSTRKAALAVAGPAPTIGSVAPNSGPSSGGTPVVVTGTNFVSGSQLTIGGAAATSVIVASDTSISAATPAGPAGTADIVVTNPDGQTATLPAAFTYVSTSGAETGGSTGSAVTPVTGTTTKSKSGCSCDTSSEASTGDLLWLSLLATGFVFHAVRRRLFQPAS